MEDTGTGGAPFRSMWAEFLTEVAELTGIGRSRTRTVRCRRSGPRGTSPARRPRPSTTEGPGLVCTCGHRGMGAGYRDPRDPGQLSPVNVRAGREYLAGGPLDVRPGIRAPTPPP
ncbi:DUF4872 domain-containing protein [Streptomyces sp. NPDC004237]|uniref:DUF4872 domain-containing protein n=1 Tax=Streptomyces sp. NPDC004237 TaxID=3154455 RepID=UPI0033A24C83